MFSLRLTRFRFLLYTVSIARLTHPVSPLTLTSMAKRKRSAVALSPPRTTTPIPPPTNRPPVQQRRSSRRIATQSDGIHPDTNTDTLDTPDALRASPDGE